MRFLAALLLAALLAPPLARANEPGAVARLDMSIREVTTDGRWADGGRVGVYRFVVVDNPDGRTARVHVQWLATPTGTVTAIVASEEIVEVSELQVDVTEIEIDASQEGRFRARFDAVDHDGHGSTRLELVATAPGRYTLVKSR